MKDTFGSSSFQPTNSVRGGTLAQMSLKGSRPSKPASRPSAPVVRVTRRRPAGPSGAQPSGRAQAPTAPPRPSSSGTPSGGLNNSGNTGYTGNAGGYGGTSSGGYSSGGTSGGFNPLSLLTRLPLKWIIIGGVILLCLCVVLPMIFQIDLSSILGGLETTGYENVDNQPPAGYEQPTTGPVVQQSTQVFPAGTGEGTWLVMLYQDADDKILEQDIFLDMNEAERVGSGGDLTIVAQLDRYQAGFSGDGDWTSARRYYVTQDNDLGRISSQMVSDLGEVNMADTDTLVDFATWAIQTYPADHYVLILSDHGMGWPGGWSDASASGRGDSSFPLAAAIGDHLFLNEIDDALTQIRSRTGVQSFDLIGMDACLMGHIEVLSALAPHAQYAVLSQETEPALGWAYASFLGALRNDPSMGGAQLGSLIVDSYIIDDQRIVDNQARAEFVGRGSPLDSLFGVSSGPTAEQITRQLSQNITLTAADLSQVPALMNALNNLAYAMQSGDQRVVAQARSYAQSFTSIFGEQVPPSYIDLGSFVELVARNSSDSAVNQATNEVLAAIQAVVVAEKHGPKRPGATGISVYFPNSAIFQNARGGMESYTAAADRFAGGSLWDEFLVYHYTGRGFDMTTGYAAVPSRTETIASPAAGGTAVTPIQASSSEVSPGEYVLLSSDIRGENIGYVRLLVGYLDTAQNAVFLMDSDYLQSSTTRELRGVYYPEWSADAFTMEFEWEPIVYAINDGVNSVVANFTPQSYGATPEEAIYTVDGIYTDTSGDRRYARLYFVNGVLQQVFGFTGDGTSGSPREIIPQTGDQFTVLDTWMYLDASGKVVQTVQAESETLTFGSQMFVWEVLYAPAGQYIVGFLVEDLDGGSQAVYTAINVK